MSVYKIKQLRTGLFSTGGANPKWAPTGTSWATLAGVCAHLRQFCPTAGPYALAVVVRYSLVTLDIYSPKQLTEHNCAT